MWPDRVLTPGPLALVSGALQTALRGLADQHLTKNFRHIRTILYLNLSEILLKVFSV